MFGQSSVARFSPRFSSVSYADVHHAELLLARPARALERRDDVCVGRGRDEAVADAARELRGVRLRCGDEDVDAASGSVVDAGVVDGVVLAAVRLLAALPEEPEDADRFLEHLEALVRERPAAAEHVLVEVLAAADSEEEAAGHHAADGRRRLRDDRGMDADQGAGHAGADANRRRRLCDAAERRPDERAVSLLVDPRVVVVGDEAEREACVLGEGRLPDELVRGEVL